MDSAIFGKTDWMLAGIVKNFPFDISSCLAESFGFGRDMTSIAGQVVLFII